MYRAPDNRNSTVDAPVCQFCPLIFRIVMVNPLVWIRGVAVLPHLLLFKFLSSSLRILPNQMLLSHYFRLKQ